MSCTCFFEMCPCSSFSIFIFLKLMQMALISVLRVWQGRFCQREAKMLCWVEGPLTLSSSTPSRCRLLSVRSHDLSLSFQWVYVTWCGMKWNRLFCLVAFWNVVLFFKKTWKVVISTNWKYIFLSAAVWFKQLQDVSSWDHLAHSEEECQWLPNKGH